MLSSRLSSETARICAVLHDVLEDTDVSKEELHELFGNDVVWNLQLLTHAPNEPYADYIHRVMQSSIAIEVKLADLDDNAQWERLRYLNEHDSSRMMKKYTMAYQMLIQKEN
jgi:(p)ppGpp synthase/HD superfamily hydrolase